MNAPQQSDDHAEAIARIEREFDVFVAQIRRTARANAQAVSDGMLPGAFKVLGSIARAGSITMSELTELLMIDKGQMSRTVRELDERGLIERSPDPADGRSMLLSLSEHGAERIAVVHNRRRDILRTVLHGWSVSDIDRFAQMLHALMTGLDTEDQERRAAQQSSASD